MTTLPLSFKGKVHTWPPDWRGGDGHIPLIPLGFLHNEYQNGEQQEGGADNPHNYHQLIPIQGHRLMGLRSRSCWNRPLGMKKVSRGSQYSRRAESPNMPNSSTQVRKQKEKARLHPISGYRHIISIRLRVSPTPLFSSKVWVKLGGRSSCLYLC